MSHSDQDIASNSEDPPPTVKQKSTSYKSKSSSVTIVPNATTFEETNSDSDGDASTSTSSRPRRSIIRSRHEKAHKRDSGSSEKSGSATTRKSILIRRHSEPSSPDESIHIPGIIKHGNSTGPSDATSVSSSCNDVVIHGSKSVSSSYTDQVRISVGDAVFTVELDLIRSKPDTMLGRMFSKTTMDTHYTQPNHRGDYEIQSHVCQYCFQSILDFYTTGQVVCPPSCEVHELKEACDYFMIPFDITTVKCQNLRAFLKEISNDGARLQFGELLENILLPKLVASARSGERESEVVILAEDDVVDWDNEYLPPLHDEHGQIVHSNRLFKFFKYTENREVAKSVMKERGLKKIKMGVEGYPTTLDKVKRKADNRLEVVYNYIQRPYVHVSWEYEDSKSRHVDFQCVNMRIMSDPAALVVAAAEHEGDHQIVQQVQRRGSVDGMNDGEAGDAGHGGPPGAVHFAHHHPIVHPLPLPVLSNESHNNAVAAGGGTSLMGSQSATTQSVSAPTASASSSNANNSI